MPIRGPKKDPSSGNQNDNDDAASQENAANVVEEDLMPRTDISPLITDELLAQLNDKNWKERQAGLERLDQILKENKFIVANLNELPATLNKRLTDTNKILSQNSLKLCEKLAEAMGANGKKYCGQLASGMIQALSDNKELLRKQAIQTLNAWYTNCGGLLPFLEAGDVLVESFQTTNPNLKAELCGWLASVFSKSKKLPLDSLKPIISPVLTCIEDRSQDVRGQAQGLIEPLMQHVGANEMLRVLQKSKPSSISTIQPLLEKARADLAAKAPAPVVQQAAAKVVDTKTMTKNPTKPTAKSTAPTSAKSTVISNSIFFSFLFLRISKLECRFCCIQESVTQQANDYNDDQQSTKGDDKKAKNGKVSFSVRLRISIQCVTSFKFFFRLSIVMY